MMYLFYRPSGYQALKKTLGHLPLLTPTSDNYNISPDNHITHFTLPLDNHTTTKFH